MPNHHHHERNHPLVVVVVSSGATKSEEDNATATTTTTNHSTVVVTTTTIHHPQQQQQQQQQGRRTLATPSTMMMMGYYNTTTNNNASQRRRSYYLDCTRPNSNAQWILSGLLIGGFMFVLLVNQTNNITNHHLYSSSSQTNRKTSISNIVSNDVVLGISNNNNNNVPPSSLFDGNNNMKTTIDDSATLSKRTSSSSKQKTVDHTNDDDDTDQDESAEDNDVTTTNKNTNQSSNVKQITILGERNSGTRWTFEHMSNCFNHSLYVRRRLTRYKHWFQYNDPSQYPHNTLVLAQFRNPYDWFKAMEHVPHHSPAHLRAALYNFTNTIPTDRTNDWMYFLSKPWTTERVGLDLQMKGDELCQENFRYKDIISCAYEPLPKSAYNHTLRYSENQPFYEMRNDGSGEPYESIMEMRTDKIRNFLNVKNYEGVTDVWPLQYEALVRDGTVQLIQRIEAITGIKAHCTPKEPQPHRVKSGRYIAPVNAEFIRRFLNWTVEARIGYEPELEREIEEDKQQQQQQGNNSKK